MDKTTEILIWSPDRETFLATFAALKNPLSGAPLAQLDQETGVLVPSDGMYLDEIGEVMKVPPEVDEEGNVTTPAVMIPGHHVNVLVFGALRALLIAGLPQDEGLTIFETTRILSLLGKMTWADSSVGEPVGLVGSSGVKISDPAAVHSRSRVWA